MNREYDDAVSPVVGVMLMLVIVIIIAAIVSAYSGGLVSGQKKVPQATFTGKYSISNGFVISHGGGDSIPNADLVFVVRNGPLFGQNLEQKSAQILNKSTISNSNGQYLDNSAVTAVMSGESLFIDGTNSSCSILQPDIAKSTPGLCFSTDTNVGKVFLLEVSTASGKLISSTDVTITR
jgi:hypothetical protein